MSGKTKQRKDSGKLLVSIDLENEAPRRVVILEAAARMFSQGGYDSVGMRQIADAAGIPGGSIYHQFESKQEIYIEVHRAALARSAQRVATAVEGISEPWKRLEAAIAAQLEGQLDPASVTWPMINDRSALSGEMRAALVRDRDAFEAHYKQMIRDLPLPQKIDRNILRINLLAMLNSVTTWYKPGKLTPTEIAAQIIRVLQPTDSIR